MYLDRITIEAMLEKAGIQGYSYLYLSSEARAVKETTNLFKYVLEFEEIEASKLFHIGDNYEKDYKSAKKVGANSFYMPSSHELMKRFINENKGFERFAKCFSFKDELNKDRLLSVISHQVFADPFSEILPTAGYNYDL